MSASGEARCLAILSNSVTSYSSLPFNIRFSFFSISQSPLNICSRSLGIWRAEGAGKGICWFILCSRWWILSSFWSKERAIPIISFRSLSISTLESVILRLRCATSSESSAGCGGATTTYFREGFLSGEPYSFDLALASASFTGLVLCLRAISLLIWLAI